MESTAALATAGEVPLRLAALVQRCNQCAICSGTCPKARVKPGFLPRRMVYDVITGNSSRVIDSGMAWHCLTCRQCEVKCPMGVNFVHMIRELRREMLLKGIRCTLAHDNTFGSSLFDIMKHNNVKPNRKKFLAKDVKTSDESEVLYFMGCITYLDIVFKDDVGSEGMDIADNTIRLLNAIGIQPAIAEEEKCCGHDQLWRGDFKTFEELAKQNEFLKRYKTIVTNCPECYRTLAVDYKEKLGIDLNVKHISEILLEHKDKLKGMHGKTVTYHDACRLGRYMGVYDAPRELLKSAGYEVKEMAHAKEESLCCGVPQFVNCDDESKEIRRRKLKEAIATEAEMLITPCPKCQIHLKCLQVDGSEQLSGKKYNIEILDLSTALVKEEKK